MGKFSCTAVFLLTIFTFNTFDLRFQNLHTSLHLVAGSSNPFFPFACTILFPLLTPQGKCVSFSFDQVMYIYISLFLFCLSLFTNISSRVTPAEILYLFFFVSLSISYALPGRDSTPPPPSRLSSKLVFSYLQAQSRKEPEGEGEYMRMHKTSPCKDPLWIR